MQRYFAIDKKENLLIVSENDLHHIKNVMRKKNGDKVEVVYEDILYLGMINDNEISIIEIIDEKKSNQIIRIIIPFLKETKLDFILQKATELNASEVILIETERSVVKIKENKLEEKLKRWNKICKEAAEQSKRLEVPTVKFLTSPNVFSLTGVKLICHPNAKQTVTNSLKNIGSCDTINILIGPEGGFSPKEVSIFEKNGFSPINLGENILRVETVPLFLLSILYYKNLE